MTCYIKVTLKNYKRAEKTVVQSAEFGKREEH
jgi:hypothetical protein